MHGCKQMHVMHVTQAHDILKGGPCIHNWRTQQQCMVEALWVADAEASLMSIKRDASALRPCKHEAISRIIMSYIGQA